MPKESRTEGGGGKSRSHSLWVSWELELDCNLRRANVDILIVISDPDDPKFDLEAYLTMKMADETK